MVNILNSVVMRQCNCGFECLFVKRKPFSRQNPMNGRLIHEICRETVVVVVMVPWNLYGRDGKFSFKIDTEKR